MYDVYLGDQAERDLDKIPRFIREKMLEKITGLGRNPKPHGCRKLKGDGPSDWRIRVGDYRVIYSILEPERRVEVLKIRHRSEVYRRFGVFI